MPSIRMFLLSLALLVPGCTAATDYLVHYRSVPPFEPRDPNELLAELTGGLPETVEIRQFLYHRKTDEMRGIVLVSGTDARSKVCDAVRVNPRLSLVGPGAEEVHSTGKSLICFSSQPPFVPADGDDLLAELKRGLPPGIEPVTVRSKSSDGKLILWVLVQGNFGKEMVKFALRENPHLALLQVEKAPLFLRP